MKQKSAFLTFSVAFLIIMASAPSSYGQDTISQKSEMLDLKLQLLDSKLELLDVKIKLWESKPKELDIKLDEIDSKINSMDFNPQEINTRLNEMDSLIRVTQEEQDLRSFEYQPPMASETETEPVFIPSYMSAISLDPVRLLEGTFCLSYERILNSRFSLNFSGMATYSTTQGISNYYFTNQSFEYFDAVSNMYQPYEGEVMAGGGFNIQLRNYLLANHNDRQKAPLGLYAAPQVTYRNMKITGYTQEWTEVEPDEWEMVDTEVVQHLNVFAGGVMIGMKLPLFKVMSIDIFAGGNIRLSKYKGEDGFTRYKNWFNIDFSGVSPMAGIAIGILK
ncbi:MAG: hypothetical protein RBT02_05865 [Bacteroidales bacterium]|jgi:hypothetical protein|nr:hypothetical protein [Bacteroidales bacterium]